MTFENYHPFVHNSQIQCILDDSSTPEDGEEFLAVMTASERTEWARVREQYFATGVNRNSLNTVETAAFVLVLDDYEYDYDPVST